MPTVTFILGLLCSGKTFLAEKMEKESGVKNFPDFASFLPQKYNELVKELRSGKDCVVVDIAYCIGANRKSIVKCLTTDVQGVHIEWICFKKSLNRSLTNIKIRHRKGFEKEMDVTRLVYAKYTYPIGAKKLQMVDLRKLNHRT